MNTTQLTTHCQTVADTLKSLSNPDRLKLICALWDGEKTVRELENYAQISQSMVSQHLNRLRLESIVASRKDGVFVYYHISDDRVRRLAMALHDIFCKGAPQ